MLPLLAVLLYCNSACAGVVTARRLVQPSGEASLQVLSSLLRSLCKSEHRNTQAGELTMKHQTGRLPCQVFKVSQRKLVLKDFSGTHCVLTHCIRHGFISSFKKLSFKSISQKLPAQFLFVRYLRNVLEVLSLSLASYRNINWRKYSSINKLRIQ